MLESLSMECNTYYDKKRESVNLFAICLWDYKIPAMRDILAAGKGNDGEPNFFGV